MKNRSSLCKAVFARISLYKSTKNVVIQSIVMVSYLIGVRKSMVLTRGLPLILLQYSSFSSNVEDFLMHIAHVNVKTSSDLAYSHTQSSVPDHPHNNPACSRDSYGEPAQESQSPQQIPFQLSCSIPSAFSPQSKKVIRAIKQQFGNWNLGYSQ